VRLRWKWWRRRPDPRRPAGLAVPRGPADGPACGHGIPTGDREAARRQVLRKRLEMNYYDRPEVRVRVVEALLRRAGIPAAAGRR
jgi:hypothetical protein